MNPNSETEWGAHPPRVLFSAPSRKTRGAQNSSGSRSTPGPSEAGREGAACHTRGRVCSPTSDFGVRAQSRRTRPQR